ncbi:unnamed protein product [Rotaria socialis]|uniref:Microbial-type PARG catalytic domain-containing protein n=1 Tax=Rotaria socialis TaxID=392032 RepID=A0A818W0D5_9BILA|nr:unnamed protein product [Rotaria socialis]CAF4564494.1 unnamed protein product [Rotaria socialis]
MDDSQRTAHQQFHTTSDTQSNTCFSAGSNIKYRPMPDPLSVYVPLESLTQETINSVISTVQHPDRRVWDFSKRTLLAFLLAIDNSVSEIERNGSNNKYNEHTIQHAARVRQLLVHQDHAGKIEKLDWTELRERYDKMAREKDDGTAKYFGAKNAEPYYELSIGQVHPDVIQSRKYMARFRSSGWKPEELKIYWNVQQLENLCPKHETESKKGEEKLEPKCEAEDNRKNETTRDMKLEKTEVAIEAKAERKDAIENQMNARPTEKEKSEATNEILSPHDPSDADIIQALRECPVSKRNNAGKITYVNTGIEKAVFDIPETAQIIVLNFANERSPGGGYLRHTWAQEEIILYNSDGYRALLDLKYGRMGGGYAIPEFGLAYVRDIRFVDKNTGKNRKTDMLVSACYCLTGSPKLYANPTSKIDWETKTLAKFRAFMAAAVANTRGDGSNTYLLLGPIGTGDFGNNVTEIGKIFRRVLMSNLMGSNGPVIKAFEHIWFVSTDTWKNDKFKQLMRSKL